MARFTSHIFSYVVFALLLLGVSLTHTGCDGFGNPKDPLELGPYKWGDFWLPYVYFKEGTWWVYESTFEGETRYDTVTVTSSTHEILRYDNGPIGSWKVTKEYFRYEMNSTFQGYVIHQSPHVGILDAVDTLHYSRFIILRNVWGDGEIRPFFIFRSDYQHSGTGSTKTTFDGMKDGIEISNKVYDDVAVFDIDRDWSWNNIATGPPAKYYWAKGVGIIKRESDYLKEEWHLVDYHIVQ